MFGDGKIEVINQNGELYINMWELVQHLDNSADLMLNEEGENVIASTLSLVAYTLCDLALYELGMETLGEFDNVESMLKYWDSHR